MKKTTSLLMVLAGVAAVSAVVIYRKKFGTDFTGRIADTLNEAGNKIRRYGRQLKDRLMHDVHGPNGEHVYADMYDRHFYEDPQGKRIYLETT
ncbi:hypothetical protein [Hufsiella ginkgonis]|uniref:Uncharacterized protein n=1 Tax=Hufsiella ginkgonis TaxID=2695274 RepID=A0A7K1Y1Y9_9SPHI|nr:hypothetical protein [Hufsiella ginkgonis]MXV17117.1 hypothetical protein [Hufsiella ginkgonis]